MALQQNNKIMKYDKYSARAEEFINHQEILDTIAYVEANKDNKEPVSYTHLYRECTRGVDQCHSAIGRGKKGGADRQAICDGLSE